MAPLDIVKRDLLFGPFKTDSYARSVDDRLRRAILQFFQEQILPRLDGTFTRLEGGITSHYDTPDFVRRSELRVRYYLECTFHSPEGDEAARGELVYDPDSGTCVESKVKPLSVRSLKWHPPAPSASGPQPICKPGVCPRCGAPVTGALGGIVGMWDGYNPKTRTCIWGSMYQATCGACGATLLTFLDSAAEVPTAENCVWEAR